MNKVYKIKSKIINSNLKLLIFALVFFILGCPQPPPKSIIYAENQKKKDNYELNLLDDKLKIKVTCSGKLSEHRKRYSMSLGVFIDYSKLKEKLRFNLDNIEIYINNNALTKVEVQRRNSFNLRETNETYSDGSNYYINLNSDQFDELVHKEHNIIIVLEKFIVMNDNYLFIDTINAYDPTIIIE